MSLDLDAYFDRIGYRGSRSPTLATLQSLMAAHVVAIPFENLDVLLGRRNSLNPEALFHKLVTEGRGGYCFEQNGLMLAVLEALGYQVAPLSARARLDRPRDFTPPRTHLLVRVELEGESWLVDVGIGALSLTAPLRLAREGEQSTPHEPRRLIREGGRIFHQARFGSDWVDVCEFTLETMPLIDREVAHWFTSTHPESHFKHRLLVARATPEGGRVTLLNRDLKVRAPDGRAALHRIESPEELLAVLGSQFHLHFPPETRFPCAGLDWSGAE